jgi:hypothetical protein
MNLIHKKYENNITKDNRKDATKSLGKNADLNKEIGTSFDVTAKVEKMTLE